MVRPAVATLLVLALPALGAAGTWRWHDAAGRLHYTNIAPEAPPQALDLDAGDDDAAEWTIDSSLPPLPPLPPREDRLPTSAGEDTRYA